MVEPSRPRTRRALAGGVAAAVALAGAGFAVGRDTAPRPEPAPVVAPRPSPSPSAAPPIPVTTLPFGRADLLAAVRAAADALAAGRPLPPEVAALDGRRFQLRLPFGCRGPTPDDAPLGWRYDEAAEALRVRAAPAPFDPATWLPPEAAAQIDSAEGFWIDRPWTSGEDCPPMSAAPPPAPPERTLALAQFHGTDESRVGRRDGDAYQAVEKVAPDALDVSQGLHLRLSGRIAAAPGAGPVLCRAPAGLDARPVCLVSVSLDQVAIENPATAAALATWDVARDRSAAD